MTFQLDTRGAVDGVLTSYGDPLSIMWGELTPFAQGYVEALLADALLLFNVATPPKFTSLAPEALARIIADCEEGRKIFAKIGPSTQSGKGRQFWSDRQDEMIRRFPPRTVQLGDDGKVRFS